ncbi:MAG: hypothetical protein M3H12_01250, partial [Chromatiales bacterium]
ALQIIAAPPQAPLPEEIKRKSTLVAPPSDDAFAARRSRSRTCGRAVCFARLAKENGCFVFLRASLLSLSMEDCTEYIPDIFGSFCVPFSKNREQDTRTDCG